MKTSRETAEYGGAVRLNYGATSGDLLVHPDRYRLYSVTVGASHIIDLVLPEVGIQHMRAGSRVHMVHRGIGGTGNLRVKLATGPTYWDFVSREFVEAPGADCLIGPGYICTATYVGSGAVVYYCTRKLATPNTIL